MKNSIKTLLDAYVHDNADFIKDSGYTVAEFILADTEAEDHGWYWFLTDSEIEEFENSKEARERHINEIKEFVTENYNYKPEADAKADAELAELRKTFGDKRRMYAPANFKCESAYAKEDYSTCDCGESRCYFFELNDQKLHKVVCCDVCYKDAPAPEQFV